MASLALTFAALASLLLAVASAAADGAESLFHALPSGRRVPLAAIRSHPLAARDGAHARQLYELTARGELAGPSGASVALHAHTSSEPLTTDRPLRVTLNGRDLDAPLAGATVRRGDGFSAVYADGDDLPAAISVRGVDLVPLHFADHPGVYIAPATPASVKAVRTADNAEELGLAAGQQAHGPIVHEAEIEEDGAAAYDAMKSDLITGAQPKTAARAALLHDARHADNTRLAGTVRQARKCGPGAAKRFYELAVAFDSTLCARYDNKAGRAAAAITAAVQAGNAAFWTDTCLRMAVVHIEAHCRGDASTDPYMGQVGKLLQFALLNFEKVWKSKRQWVRRDLALLLVGYAAPDAWTSVTSFNSACSKKFGYAVAERVEPRGIAAVVAFTIGGRVSRTGLLKRDGKKLRLGRSSAARVRAFLETDARSWCITPRRRFCKPGCARCVSGACVVGPATRATPRKCGATFVPARPLACAPRSRPTRYVSPWLDVVWVSAGIENGQLVTRAAVQVGTVKLEIGYGVGGAATSFVGAPRTTRFAEAATFRTRVADLDSGGGSCCGKQLFYTLRVGGCLEGSCGVARKTYSIALRCPKVCSGAGTPLPMSDKRKCPTCAIA